jgi:predicted transcriptional regulator
VIPYDQRNEDNRFSPQYPDNAFLDAIRNYDIEDELPTTPTIAEIVGCDRRTALYRLDKLAEDGQVRKIKAGASVVWDIPE